MGRKNGTPTTRRIKEEVDVDLTEHEKAEMGQLWAQREAEIEANKEALKLKNKPLQDEADKLRKALETGKESRMLELDLDFDIARATVTYRVRATGEVVRTRTMEASELERARQGDLSFVDEPAGGEEQRSEA